MKVIRDLGGDNFIMCCWEPPGEFCHRRVVAAWLRKHTGVLMEEFIPSHKRHAEWLGGYRKVKPYEPIDETIPDWPDGVRRHETQSASLSLWRQAQRT